MTIRKLILAFILFCSFRAAAQQAKPNELGNFFVTNYSRSFLNSVTGNWSVLQDHNGVIFIANAAQGVSTYDGQKIRRVLDKDGHPVDGLARTVLIDSKHTVYTVINRAFGTIEKNKFGEDVFFSISDTLNEKEKVSSSIWSAFMFHDTCFIQSEKAVYLLKDKKVLKVILFDHPTHTLKVTTAGVFLRVWGVGHFKFENGEFKLIPSTKELFSQNRIDQQYYLDNGDNLLVSRNIGLWYLKPNGELLKANTKAIDDFVITGESYVGSGTLKNGIIPIATSKKGLMFVDQKLDIKYILDTSNGLETNNIYYYIQDRSGDIWGTGVNVFRASFDTTLTYFSKLDGLSGTISNIKRINGALFVRSNRDLYRFLPKQTMTEKSVFEKTNVNESGEQVLVFDDQIITTNNYTIKTTKGNVTKVISPIYRSTVSIRSKLNPSLIFTSNYTTGLLVHQYKNGKWKQLPLINKDTILCADVIEPIAGTIVINSIKGMYKYQYDQTGQGVFTKLNMDKKFFKTEVLGFQKFNEDTYLCIDSALHFYTLDLDKNLLKYSKYNLGNIINGGGDWSYSYNPETKNGWMFTRKGLFRVRFDLKTGFSTTEYPFYKIDFSELSSGLLAEGSGDNEVLWIGSQDDKLYRYYPHLAKKEKQQKYKALIRAIFSDGQKMPMVLGDLPFNKNNLSFEVAYPVFGNESKTTFSYWLEGQDSTWTPFVSDFKKEYTNLHEGKYIFHVRAKEASGAISEEGILSFSVNPPWYRTIWAYGVYFLTLIFCFIQFGKYQAKKSFQKADNERKSAELTAATDLQNRLLPKVLPKNPNLDIACYLRTSTEVGGDYYDFFEQADGSLYAICGDATGHGTPSGMLVSITKAGIIGLPQLSPKDMLHELNRVVKKVDLGILRMSLNIALVKGNELTLSSAGMPPYYIYRAAAQSTEEIMLSGIPLGSFNNALYDQIITGFNTGDILVILSDGLPEAPNASGDLFDYPRVQSLINNNYQLSAQALIDLLIAEVDSWLAGARNPDDITLVIIKHL